MDSAYGVPNLSLAEFLHVATQASLSVVRPAPSLAYNGHGTVTCLPRRRNCRRPRRVVLFVIVHRFQVLMTPLGVGVLFACGMRAKKNLSVETPPRHHLVGTTREPCQSQGGTSCNLLSDSGRRQHVVWRCRDRGDCRAGSQGWCRSDSVSASLRLASHVGHDESSVVLVSSEHCAFKPFSGCALASVTELAACQLLHTKAMQVSPGEPGVPRHRVVQRARTFEAARLQSIAESWADVKCHSRAHRKQERGPPDYGLVGT